MMGFSQKDCDDNDPQLRAIENDNDCDGVTAENDCNDSSPISTIVIYDEDCDGVLTDEDCDDNDENSDNCRK